MACGLSSVMGWHGGHLHELEVAGERYGTPDPEFDWGNPPRSDWRIQLKTARGEHGVAHRPLRLR
ncbi:MAG: hypothetical protein JNJ44_10730 [Zoogloeaceae bacterium]|nr:hypothetical protein [Zoogloeaceae bacterium]